jgi:hypothetical protein
VLVRKGRLQTAGTGPDALRTLKVGADYLAVLGTTEVENGTLPSGDAEGILAHQ